MLAWWVSDLWNSTSANGKVILISWIYWVIFSIVLHELAHGFVAIWCGDRTPIETGHMTWNPLVHMGPVSLLLFAVAGIAWGLMPINPNNLRRPWHEALVAVAGPAMNLLLAALAIGAYALWIGAATGHWSPSLAVNPTLLENTQIFLRVGIMLNLALCAFNLIPVPPLDGSRILAHIVPAYRRFLESEQATHVSLVAFVILFFFAGEYVFGFAMTLTRTITGRVEDLIFPP
jgi:Zn-dependent protease